MALSKERKGEIALALLKYRLKREGLQLNNLKRELGNAAQATGIPLNELTEFIGEMFAELTEEVLTFRGSFDINSIVERAIQKVDKDYPGAGERLRQTMETLRSKGDNEED